MNGWEDRLKLVKELGAVGILGLLALGQGYFIMVRVSPALDEISMIRQAIAEQRVRDTEHVRLSRLNCRSLALLAKSDTSRCEERGQ